MILTLYKKEKIENLHLKKEEKMRIVNNLTKTKIRIKEVKVENKKVRQMNKAINFSVINKNQELKEVVLDLEKKYKEYKKGVLQVSIMVTDVDVLVWADTKTAVLLLLIIIKDQGVVIIIEMKATVTIQDNTINTTQVIVTTINTLEVTAKIVTVISVTIAITVTNATNETTEINVITVTSVTLETNEINVIIVNANETMMKSHLQKALVTQN